MRIASGMAREARVDAPDPKELASALSGALNVPLGALRASMESLLRELERESPSRSMIPAVLGEVGRLSHRVRDLIDYSSPPVPQPLSCTTGEIAVAARNALEREDRERIHIARYDLGSRLFVDGPIVTRCLERLLWNSIEAGAPSVLVTCRSEARVARFAVVDRSGSTFDPEAALRPFQTGKSNHLGLGLPLVNRDIGLLGGTLRFSVTPGGAVCAQLEVPDAEEAR